MVMLVDRLRLRNLSLSRSTAMCPITALLRVLQENGLAVRYPDKLLPASFPHKLFNPLLPIEQ